MFSTPESSKNAKLGLVEKLVFEKNDILGQNFRSKSKTDVKKVCQKISCLPQSPASSKYFFIRSKMSQRSTKNFLENYKELHWYIFFGSNREN